MAAWGQWIQDIWQKKQGRSSSQKPQSAAIRGGATTGGSPTATARTSGSGGGKTELLIIANRQSSGYEFVIKNAGEADALDVTVSYYQDATHALVHSRSSHELRPQGRLNDYVGFEKIPHGTMSTVVQWTNLDGTQEERSRTLTIE